MRRRSICIYLRQRKKKNIRKKNSKKQLITVQSRVIALCRVFRSCASAKISAGSHHRNSSRSKHLIFNSRRFCTCGLPLDRGQSGSWTAVSVHSIHHRWLGERSHFQWSGDEGWEPVATFILGFPPVWQDARSHSRPSPWKENVRTQPIAQRLAVG